MAALMPTSTSNASSSWPSARATADSTRSLDNIVCKGVGRGEGGIEEGRGRGREKGIQWVECEGKREGRKKLATADLG